MKTPHIHAEFIKAWADGAEIEVWHGVCKVWHLATNPSWSMYLTYRIKPEPKPDIKHQVKINLGASNSVICIYNSESNYTSDANLYLIFDGETRKLKDAKVI